MNGNRLIGLDILRAVAILMVIWCHGIYIVYGTMNEFIGNAFSMYGHLGVALFFVLSGFLVGKIFHTDIVFNKEFSRGKIFTFWIRRWFRTVPNYYLFLIIYFILFYLTSNDILTLQNPHPNLIIQDLSASYKYFLFIQNFSTNISSFFGQSWSLSVEEWFYLLLPLPFLFLIVVKKNNSNQFFTVLIWLFVLIQVWKLYSYVFSPSEFVGLSVIFNLDNILIGVILANIYLKKPELLEKKKNFLLVLGLMMLAFVHLIYIKFIIIAKPVILFVGIVNLFIAIGYTLIMPFFIYLKYDGKLIKIIQIISLSSYTLYLSHFLFMVLLVDNFLINFFPDQTHLSRYFVFFLFLFSNIAFSYFHYKHFEVPVMKLRDSKVISRVPSLNLKKMNL